MRKIRMALIALSMLVALVLPVSAPAAFNCINCCGEKPPGDASAWYACMHFCQDMVNQGNPPKCDVN